MCANEAALMGTDEEALMALICGIDVALMGTEMWH
ncbi:unnamed protein product [Staurois parvus]|uniref:Uncharacterized protein n=1 Tax=Staurois parvus TaxID=386267 RepID=A0ABN9CNP2_9NEOB|nr:unnamed protein product [Staurois parvus]